MKRSLIISFSFFCFTVCIQAEQTNPCIVHFPKDQAVGRLMIRDIGPSQHYTVHFGWELLGQAQGDVTIPEGKDLRLEIYRDVTDISFISEIKPNDLESLSLRNTNIVDEDFVHLKDLTDLLALDLSSMKQINGSGLVHLANLKSLKELTFFNTGIEDSALEHISKFHSLERLTLYWTRINGSGLIHINNLTSLKNLSLSKTSITDESLVYLKDMTWLKELELYDTQISEDGLAYLKGLTSLEKLILGSLDRESGISPITDAGLAHLSSLTKLRNLGLYRTRITDKGLKHLSGLTNLETLSLNRTQITGEGFAFLNKFAPLRGLELDECALPGVGLANLKAWSITLENLDMRGAKLKDADLVHLANLKALKYINLSDTPISDEGLVHIKNIRSLETLFFSNTKITDKGLMILKDLPNLKRIDITGTLVSNTGLESFKQASASKSIEANNSRMMVTSKEGGLRLVKSVSPQPEAKPLPLIGKPIPDLDKIDADFDQLQLKGKMALICFWDMNQRPSRHCIKNLAEKAGNFADKGISVLCVHASEIDEKTLNDWMRDYNVPFPTKTITRDAEKIRFAWGVKSLPWLILTDNNHVVINEGFGIAEIGDILE